jgi:primosomal protein N' (replication factor Y)
MISLTVSSDTQDKADRDAYIVRQALNGNYKTIGVLTLLKINDRFRSRVLLKGQDLDEMRRDVRAFLGSPEGSRIKDLRIDVNPLVLD